jgi:acyl dehydratase
VLFDALAGGPFAGPASLAHGLYVLAISGGLMFLAGDRGIPRSTIALWGLETVRFSGSPRTGDTLRVEAEVRQTTQVDATRGLIAMSNTTKNQRGEEILTYTSKILAGRRPASAGSRVG